MNRRHTPLIVAALAALAVATPAHANAGTGMMWMGLLHLLFGNLFIGLIEWGVLYMLLRDAQRRHGLGPVIMVGANYVSAWVGFALLVRVWPGVVSQFFPQPLVQAGAIIGVSWVLLFVLTVLIEWPFVRWAANRNATRRWGFGRALGASLVVNVVTYAMLVALYYGVSPVTLVTRTQPAAAAAIAGQLPARVYYLDDGGGVWEMRADGTRARQVARTGVDSPRAELVLVANPQTGLLDLYCDGRRETRDTFLVLPGVAKTPRFADSDPLRPGSRPLYDGRPVGRSVVDLRPVGETRLRVGVGFWGSEGVTLGQRGEEGAVHLALETPFLTLMPSHGTALAGDVVVCQYTHTSGMVTGGSTIVAIDLRSRRLAVLATGRSPVVVLDELPAGATWWQPKRGDVHPEQFLKTRLKGPTP